MQIQPSNKLIKFILRKAKILKVNNFKNDLELMVIMIRNIRARNLCGLIEI